MDGMTYWQSEEFMQALESYGSSVQEEKKKSHGGRVVIDASKQPLSKALSKAEVI
ncbi:MAG: hypothetical protein M0P69_18125 [Bacteroidales bacterium]|nr:hypothetical protein [Bacteroidales bacterium]